MCVLPFFTLGAELLALSQYSESPTTGHLHTGLSWFPWVYKQKLRWFPTFQVATTCFSLIPPELNLLVTNFIVCIRVKYSHPPGDKQISVNNNNYYYNTILRTVNTQHTSRQDAIITNWLYLATCFGSKRPSAGELLRSLKLSFNGKKWNSLEYCFYCTAISFIIRLQMAFYGWNM